MYFNIFIYFNVVCFQHETLGCGRVYEKCTPHVDCIFYKREKWTLVKDSRLHMGIFNATYMLCDSCMGWMCHFSCGLKVMLLILSEIYNVFWRIFLLDIWFIDGIYLVETLTCHFTIWHPIRSRPIIKPKWIL